MSENQVVANYMIAVVVDGEVADTIMCDERNWALFTSNPIFVDITDNPGSVVIGQPYNV